MLSIFKKHKLLTTSFALMLGMNPGLISAEVCGYTDEYMLCETNYPDYIMCNQGNKRDWKITGFGEYLLWRTNIQNLYAADVYTVDSLPLGAFTNDSLKVNQTISHRSFSQDFDSGFRLGLGVDLPCNRWSVGASWTYYKTTSHFKEFGSSENEKTELKNVNMPLLPYVLDSISFIALVSNEGTLESKWKFNYNQVDLTFFRRFDLSCFATVTPYMGVRGLFLQNKICISGQYNAVNQGISKSIEELSSNFNSVGINGGIASTWEIAGGFGLYGNLGLSLLYSRYTTKNSVVSVLETQSPTATQELTNDMRSPYKVDALKLMTDLSFGLAWEKSVNCDRNRIFIRAGWEHHLILQGSQFEYIQSNQITTGGTGASSLSFANGSRSISGDIALYGLTVSLGFSF